MADDDKNVDDEIPEGLEGINFKINQVTDESLESTRRMIALCEEGKEAGIKTLVMLDDQGVLNGKNEGKMNAMGGIHKALHATLQKQLETVDRGLGVINADMREAEEQLAGMEKCCGLFTLPWNKTDDPNASNPEYEKVWKDDGQADAVEEQPRGGGEGFIASSGYITKVLGDDDAREGEMDENLAQVNTMVGNLRNMAIDMSSEVSNQNRLIDRINIKTDSNNQRVEAANKRAAALTASA